MNTWKLILLGIASTAFLLGFMAITPKALAVSDVTSSELQNSASMIIPSSDSIPVLDGYGAFVLQNKTNVTNGLVAKYKALLLSDPWFDSELPEVQLLIYSYSSQDTAEDAFSKLVDLSDFVDGSKTILESDEHNLFYEARTDDSYADIFSTVRAEYMSFHLIHQNGNLIYQASLYRTNGEFNSVNLQTYSESIIDTSKIKNILYKTIWHTKVALAILFPPTEAQISSQKESTSVNLNELYSVPTHGIVNLKIYVSGGATGTILDSSGIAPASEGDLYLYINSNDQIFAGIYAPNFDADCDQEGGWYRLSSADSVSLYEWNDISLHYGVGGFSLGLNGKIVDSCSVSQPRSSNVLYAGDFSGDSISESMIGYIDDISFLYSLTDFGDTWDSVLTEQLFLDLPNTDADLPVFQYLKTEGVFLGSNGLLYPDNILNRAEMVKVILKAFSREPNAGNMVPFWDVPIDAWYRKYVVKAYDIGMVLGMADKSFAPEAQINRAEFFTMLYRLRGSKKMEYTDSFSDVSEDDWYALGAEFAHENGLVFGTEFSPSAVISRREAARVLYDLLKAL